jgi:enoyl reductase-like protein
MNEDLQEFGNNHLALWQLLSTVKNEKTAKTNEILSSFLETQQAFWVSITQTLYEMNLLVESMKTIIEKGK